MRISARLVATLALACCVLPGCRVLKPVAHQPGPYTPVPQGVAREHEKVILPDYVIEPPDVLTIQAVNLMPKQPYRLRPLDTLQIEANGLPDESSLGGAPGILGREYTIGIDGTLVLGLGFDTSKEEYRPLVIAGMTIPEAQQAVRERLAETAREPKVWVTLTSIATRQDVAGEHLVCMDGTVNLGVYGRVRVVGMTIEQAKSAIEASLASQFENPEVAVDVYGYNSKVFYVVTQGAGLGDQLIQFPITGNETALDAISQVQGLSGTSSTRMWIARPGKNDCGGDQLLAIDWPGITQRGDITTNYQLMPGDRVFIAEDKLIAFDTQLAKVISPIERMFGVTLLGTQTAQRIKFFNQNNGNNGFGGGF
ncbi:polysaccharide biosynthesis/export family protein [Pirellulimonas nuda]|nr:polysaccharide biosynthesis/export family protein [Pirellulimonas nuda]